MHRLTGLAQFEGEWRLTRQIDDRAGDTSGHLTGIATFTSAQEGEVMNYAEAGELSYGGQAPMSAERRYTWRNADGQIDVLFDDGRPFHCIKLGRLMPHDNHFCDPDLYHVSYDFTGWPVWRAIWRVIGPNKNYRMVSEYSRVDR